MDRLSSIILWIARVTGTLILAFVLFFLLADILGTSEAEARSLTNTEIISAVFGIIALIGLAIALFREGIGGLIATISLVGFFIVRSDLVNSFMILFTLPGLLYLLYWRLKSRTSS